MGIRDALHAAQLIQSELYIPIHYNTFPVIEQNPYEFTNMLHDNRGLVPKLANKLNYRGGFLCYKNGSIVSSIIIN
ncbi:hypothetical protein MGH68_01795 [Erysipelothrix sp. D19-032]